MTVFYWVAAGRGWTRAITPSSPTARGIWNNPVYVRSVWRVPNLATM